jgi:hypothetical protein
MKSLMMMVVVGVMSERRSISHFFAQTTVYNTSSYWKQQARSE